MRHTLKLKNFVSRLILAFAFILTAGAFIQPAAEAASCESPCVTTLVQNGDPARVIDILYIPLGFSNTPNGVTGYTLADYKELVDLTRQFLTQYAPFNQYQSYFNIHRADVQSTFGDVDKLAAKRLAFKAPELPDADIIVHIDNLLIGSKGHSTATGVYLDAVSLGKDNAVFPTQRSAISQIAHELGHQIGQLADEYVTAPSLQPEFCDSTGNYIKSEPIEINVTKNTDRGSLKWRAWLGIGGVDLFEGAQYCAFGVYRPRQQCMMAADTHGGTYCPVCSEGLVRKFNASIQPIVAQSPVNTEVVVSENIVDFTVQIDPAIKPQGAQINKINWYLDLDMYNSNTVPQLITETSSLTYSLSRDTLLPNKIALLKAVPADSDINNLARMDGQLGDVSTQGTFWGLSADNNFSAPIITRVSSLSGWPGKTIIISGKNFCKNYCNENYVPWSPEIMLLVGNAYITPTSISSFSNSDGLKLNNDTIVFTVPDDLTLSGNIIILTAFDGLQGTIYDQQFTVIPPPPAIESFSPTSGIAGDEIRIDGKNFCTNECGVWNPSETKLQLVSFEVGQFISINNYYVAKDYILFTLPANARTGLLSVKHRGFDINTSGTPPYVLTVTLPDPVINSVDFNSGWVNKWVTVSGDNYIFYGLNSSLTPPVVQLNGVTAPIISSTKTDVTFSVPTGASSGPITITRANDGASVTSTESYHVLPPPTITAVNGANPFDVLGTPNIIVVQPGTYILVEGENFCLLDCDIETLGVKGRREISITLNGRGISGIASLLPNQILFQIPAGATSGRIGVSRPGGVDSQIFYEKLILIL